METSHSPWPAASILLPLPGLLLATLLLLAPPEARRARDGLFGNCDWRRWDPLRDSDGLRLSAWALLTLGFGQALGLRFPDPVASTPAVTGWIGFIGILVGSQMISIRRVCRDQPLKGGLLPTGLLLLLCAPFSRDAAVALWGIYAAAWLALGIGALARSKREGRTVIPPARVHARSITDRQVRTRRGWAIAAKDPGTTVTIQMLRHLNKWAPTRRTGDRGDPTVESIRLCGQRPSWLASRFNRIPPPVASGCAGRPFLGVQREDRLRPRSPSTRPCAGVCGVPWQASAPRAGAPSIGLGRV